MLAFATPPRAAQGAAAAAKVPHRVAALRCAAAPGLAARPAYGADAGFWGMAAAATTAAAAMGAVARGSLRKRTRRAVFAMRRQMARSTAPIALRATLDELPENLEEFDEDEDIEEFDEDDADEVRAIIADEERKRRQQIERKMEEVKREAAIEEEETIEQAFVSAARVREARISEALAAAEKEASEAIADVEKAAEARIQAANLRFRDVAERRLRETAERLERAPANLDEVDYEASDLENEDDPEVSAKMAQSSSAETIRRMLWEIPKTVLPFSVEKSIRYVDKDRTPHRRELRVLKCANDERMIARARRSIVKGSPKRARLEKMMKAGRQDFAMDIVMERSLHGIRAFRYRSGMRDLRNETAFRRTLYHIPDKYRKRARWHRPKQMMATNDKKGYKKVSNLPKSQKRSLD